MVILRATRRLRALLPTTDIVPVRSDGALGDWYVNRVVVNRQPLLLLVSSASLLPLLLPARDVRALPERLAAVVEARLKRCGIDDRAIRAETRSMTPVAVGPTVDRSVLGIMGDFARVIPHYIDPRYGCAMTLEAVEEQFAQTPCYATRRFDQVVFPDRKAPELLRAKWLADIHR
jgi:hypothetical protein